jgi:UDP-N-acetylmuramate dehydrogenase
MLHIQSHVSLLAYTTFRIDVQAKYIVELFSEQDVQELFASDIFKQEKKQILGGGAKTFFTGDFDGLVIKMGIKGKVIESSTENTLLVRVGAGEEWSDFVEYANAQGRAGIENLIAIP